MQNIINNIYTAGMKFLEPLSPEDTYRTVVDEATQLIGTQEGSIFLERDGILERIYASNPKLYDIKIRKNGYTVDCFKKGRASVLTTKNTGDVHELLQKLKIKSTIFIPLSYQNKPFGVLCLYSQKKEEFSDQELNILKLFGSFASLAIRKNELYNEARAAIELRDFFMSAAAHELRTPITSISGYIQLLYSRHRDDDSMEGRWIRNLMNENTRLTSLVTELLEVNRIKAGKAEYFLKELDIVMLIQRAINKLMYQYPDTVIHLDNKLKPGNTTIIGDFDRMLQVFYNVFENAAKFSEPGSDVNVSLRYRAGYFQITIKDKGSGIPQDIINNVFEGHFRPVEDGDKKGMGVGLFLVKKILEKHHSFVSIKSKINKGTTVVIRIPSPSTKHKS